MLNGKDPVLRYSMMDQILYKWTNSDAVDPTGNLDIMDLSMILDGSNLVISTTTRDHLILENWGAGGSNRLNSFHINNSWFTTDGKNWNGHA